MLLALVGLNERSRPLRAYGNAPVLEHRGRVVSTIQPMSTTDATVETAVEPTHEEPTITRHVEPESQAVVAGEPATYFKCECGREAMREQDLRSEAHKAECGAR